MDKEFLTIEEVAQEIRISVAAVRKRIKEGLLRAYRPGKRVLVRRADLEIFLKRTMQESA